MDHSRRRYTEGFQAGARLHQIRAQPGMALVASSTQTPTTPPARIAGTFEERVKKTLHPLDAFSRLLDCAESNRPPDPEDAFRFEWFGLKYLAPEQDGFRLRLRVPGGRLQSYQLRAVADAAQEFGSGCAEINARAGLDLRTIPVRDAPGALRRLEAAGLSGRGAGGDNVRAVLCDPMSGIAPGEVLDAGPMVEQLAHWLLQERAFADLPRAADIAFHGGGSGELTATEQKADIRFQAVQAAPNAGFRVQLAGAGDLGALVRPEQAVRVCAELLRIYLLHADRTDRNRATLAAFGEHWSAPRWLEELERRLDYKLTRAPQEAGAALPATKTDAGEIRPQKQPGFFCVPILAPEADGRLLSGQWQELARIADAFGSGEVRLTASGNLLLPNVPEARTQAALQALRDGVAASLLPAPPSSAS
jgi:ferredoxin-nitrite reductase